MSDIKVLITGPSLQDEGGVANYYNAVFSRIASDSISPHYLEIGSTHGKGRVLHVVVDQFRFWRALSVLEPDIVHINPSLDLRSFLRDAVFVLIAKQRHKAVLVFFRGWQESLAKKVSKRLAWIFRATYGRADAFIVLAQTFADRLKEWGILAPIRLGTTTVSDELLEGFSINQKINNIDERRTIRLLYLARLERDKGIVELILAVGKLLERGFPLSLTIAGDGPMMGEVRQTVDRLGQYRQDVQIVGYVRDQIKSDIFRSHDVYCFPTQYGEGLPNSIVEAMAFGMPIITCPVGGIADFFVDDEMGILLIERTPKSISDAIERLTCNKSRLYDIARNNYEYAQKHFLASTVAESLRESYKELFDTSQGFPHARRQSE